MRYWLLMECSAFLALLTVLHADDDSAPARPDETGESLQNSNATNAILDDEADAARPDAEEASGGSPDLNNSTKAISSKNRTICQLCEEGSTLQAPSNPIPWQGVITNCEILDQSLRAYQVDQCDRAHSILREFSHGGQVTFDYQSYCQCSGPRPGDGICTVSPCGEEFSTKPANYAFTIDKLPHVDFTCPQFRQLAQAQTNRYPGVCERLDELYLESCCDFENASGIPVSPTAPPTPGDLQTITVMLDTFEFSKYDKDLQSQLSSIASDFENRYAEGTVKANLVYPPDIVKQQGDNYVSAEDIILEDAQSKDARYDVYLGGPYDDFWLSGRGIVNERGGWADFTPYLSGSIRESWENILPGVQGLAMFDEKIVMFPLEDGFIPLLYRRDVLEQFGFDVPRTWDEYSVIANATDGQAFENETLTGSCIHAPSWSVDLVLASITQTNGPDTGHLLDTKGMTPLTDPALELTLKWLEEHAVNGLGYNDTDYDEYVSRAPLNRSIDNSCVLTYGYELSLKEFEAHWKSTDIVRIASLPGSTTVLDRNARALVRCDGARCARSNESAPDIGWINRAPLLMQAKHCSVNNHIASERLTKLSMEFCAYLSSRIQGVAFRKSDVDSGALNRYVEEGYDESVAKDFLAALASGMGSTNAAHLLNIALADDIHRTLVEGSYEYINHVITDEIPKAAQESLRKSAVATITAELVELVDSAKKITALEAYQRYRGVYDPVFSYNQVGRLRFYGYILFALIAGFSILMAAWTLNYRNSKVVRASQPVFLVLLVVGCLVFGSSMLPLGIQDDQSYGNKDDCYVNESGWLVCFNCAGCDAACMSIPFLLAFGWTIIFSVLFSKIWRVNIVYRNAQKFRRIKVSETDVLLPFAILLSLNLVILVVWTVIDPYRWTRVWTSDFDSYGTCSSRDTVASTVCFSLLVVLNALAMILANCQAYQTRHLSTSFGESKYIALAMACIFQVSLVGVPLLAIVQDNPEAAYFMSTSWVFIVAFSILGLIFIPKVIHFWRGSDSGGKVRVGGVKMTVVSQTAHADSAVLGITVHPVGGLDSARSGGVDSTRSGGQETAPQNFVKAPNPSLPRPPPSSRRQANMVSVRDLQKREFAVHHDSQLNLLRMKLGALKAVMESQNVDADALFRQVGIDKEL